MSDKDRLDKVLAVAINPGAYEQEAIAALHKARELVKREPKSRLRSSIHELSITVARSRR